MTTKPNYSCAICARLPTILVMTNQPTPGQSIRALRQLAGLTLDQVAESAKVSATHLSKVETGKARPSSAWVAVVTKAISEGMQRRVDSDLAQRIPA